MTINVQTAERAPEESTLLQLCKRGGVEVFELENDKYQGRIVCAYMYSLSDDGNSILQNIYSKGDTAENNHLFFWEFSLDGANNRAEIEKAALEHFGEGLKIVKE
jgi:hypothetical protein